MVVVVASTTEIDLMTGHHHFESVRSLRRHRNIVYHGVLSPEQWQGLLQDSKFMIGLGEYFRLQDCFITVQDHPDTLKDNTLPAATASCCELQYALQHTM